MNSQSLEEIAIDLANQARAKGCRGVIVAVSRDFPEGVHSVFHVEHRGPCLEVEGLAARVAGHVATIWTGLMSIRVANKD